MSMGTPAIRGNHSTRPRAVLNSLAGVAAGAAFLAAGWHVDVPLSRAAFADQNPNFMRMPVRLEITFARRTESFTFASIADMVSSLSSRSGQDFLTGIANGTYRGVTATVVTDAALSDASREVCWPPIPLPGSTPFEPAAD